MKPGSLARRSPFLPMEPSRKHDYLDLIGQLLDCPSGEEPALLQAHRELLDTEFLAMGEQVAQMLDQQMNQRSAQWLRNLLANVPEAIARGGTNAGAGQQEAFLKQLIANYCGSHGYPQVLYELLIANLPL